LDGSILLDLHSEVDYCLYLLAVLDPTIYHIICIRVYRTFKQ